jgi:hypothetical protein
MHQGGLGGPEAPPEPEGPSLESPSLENHLESRPLFVLDTLQ